MIYDDEIKKYDALIADVKLLRDNWGDKVSLVKREDGKMYVKFCQGKTWHYTYVRREDQPRVVEIIARIKCLPVLEAERQKYITLRNNQRWVAEMLGLGPMKSTPGD